jgi:hypothetical protein
LKKSPIPPLLVSISIWAHLPLLLVKVNYNNTIIFYTHILENVVWFVAAEPIPIGLSTYAEVAEVTCSVPLEGNDFEFLKELHEIGNGNHRVI